MIATIADTSDRYCSDGVFRWTELNRVTNAVILRAATADAAAALLDGRAIAGGAWMLAEPESELRAVAGGGARGNGGDSGNAVSGDGGNDVLLVDPPRAGLDAPTLCICHRFDHILYISCNPKALHHNLHGATCEQVGSTTK